MDTETRKGIALALIAAIISGFSVFVNGAAVKLADPVAYAVLKNAGAFALVAAFMLAIGEWGSIRNLGRRQWLTLALIGVIGGSIPFAMFFQGLALGGASVSSFIFRSLFVFAGVFGYLILKEAPEPRDVAAGFAILAGNALLVSGDMLFGAGQLLVLGATALWALEYTISRKALAEIPPRTVMAFRMLFGSALLISFMGADGSLGSLMAMNAEAFQWLLLTSVILGGFMMAWYSALKRLPVHKAASILALGGIITAALEMLFLGKSVSPVEALGLLLILLGVAVAARAVDGVLSVSRRLQALRS
ncbi:DMT family transporter [Candidatus Micrarchaeota archaeon]|nr:DMT family transporter [Candidatus Micrarchaeota archaeon]